MSTRTTARIAALALFVATFSCSAPREGNVAGVRVTVPLHVEGNRPFVDVTLHRSDGSARTARFLVDSGGGGFLMVEPLARDLGLEWGETMSEEGEQFAQPKIVPAAFVGEMPLELDPTRVAILVGRDNLLPAAAPGHADGLLPGHVLARYHVVFDYPRGTFTLARPGALTPLGDALPMPVSNGPGFPRTEIEVDGVKYGMLIDTGASFTMVSEVLLKAWGGAHSDWRREQGAAGDAKTLGGQTLETMFVPRVLWGKHELADVGLVSQQEGTFERWMTSMMAAPIVGSLAGNVLKEFRVELDYPAETLHLLRE